MVPEAVVLLRIEDLEQGRGRVAAIVTAQLIDFIQQNQRIVLAGLADGIDDPSWHGTDIGPAMAADFRLVMDPAQGHADILAAQGFRD